MIGQDEVSPGRSEKVTQFCTNNYKKNNEQTGVKNSSTKHRFAQRPPISSYYVPGSDHGMNYKSDLQPNYIPTLVNGEVCVHRKNGIRQCESDNINDMHLLVRESSRKLLVNKQRFLSHHKHEVLLVGDSHLRGCAAHMKAFLNDQFEVLGYVKAGASSKSVMDSSVKSDIGKLNFDYV
jgi:hypothetical protein